MKIEFLNLDIENFMSFRDKTSVRLDTPGYTMISGRNDNKEDSAKSNGSGKSSIFEAIIWCLTGSTVRGNKQVVNRYGNDGAVVTLSFRNNNDTYTVIRTKEHSKYKTNLFLYQGAENISGKGIKATEKILTTRFPDLTSSLISSVIILGQGLPQRFTNNTPAGRKELLEQLSKSDFMIEYLKVKVDGRKTYLAETLRQLQDKMLKQNVRKDTLTKQLEEYQTSLENSPSEELLDSSINDIEKNIIQIDSEIDAENINIAEIQQQVDNCNTFIQNESNKYNSGIDSIKNEWDDRLEELQKHIFELEFEKKTLSNKITELDSIVDVCPTCGQKLVGVEKPDTSKMKIELKKVSDRLNIAVSAKQDCEKELNTLLNAGKSEFDKCIEDKRTECSTMEINLKQCQTAVKEYESQKLQLLSNLSALKTKKEFYENNLAQLKSSIENVNNSLTELNCSIAKTEKDISETSRHIEIINKFYQAITHEFRGYLLKNVIAFINSKCKEYAKFVFNNTDIEFLLDGNNILIKYDGKEYESLSGGERQKIDLIVQFALRDMLCKTIGFSSNIIVLDEIFDNLDELGCQKVIDLISNNLKDVTSIYIISHHGFELQIPYDNIIEVVKGEDKISRIIS